MKKASPLIIAIFFTIICSLSSAQNFSLDDFSITPVPAISPYRTVTEYKNRVAATIFLSNGQLFSWGNGIQAPVIPYGKKVKEVFSSVSAFTALLDDGSILCWGDQQQGGKAPVIAPERKVVSIVSNERGFAALLDNATVVTWGEGVEVPILLTMAEDAAQKAIALFSSPAGFAAVLEDPITFQQSIISWGYYGERGIFGGYYSSYRSYFSTRVQVPSGIKVKSIAANAAAFTALYDNGTIDTWGDNGYGERPDLSNKKVVSVLAGGSAFVAFLDDGTIHTWGDPKYGGEMGKEKMSFLPERVTAVFYNGYNDFVAVLNTENLYGWGECPPIHEKFVLREKFVPPENNSSWSFSFFKRKVNIASVTLNADAMTILRDDGTIICQGAWNCGGLTPSLPRKKISLVTASFSSFTALFEDGSIQTWGDWMNLETSSSWYDFPAKTPEKFPITSRVLDLYSCDNSYIALLDNGSLFGWGKDCEDGELITFPEDVKPLWIASPFKKHTYKD